MSAVHAGIGPAAHGDLLLDIGPQHPSTHGSLRLALTLDGEVIVAAEPVVGYLHRGAEKLFEVRDYRQITVLANRHDWLSAFSNEIGVVTAVERMLGLDVPLRATWLRTLVAELNRVLAHLLFLASGPEHAAVQPNPTAFAAREAVQQLLEEAAGGRMHFMLCRVGGLLQEVPDGWRERARAVIAEVRTALPTLGEKVHALAASTVGVGVLTPSVVAAYGVSGVPARASGVALDLRRDLPYLAYGELEVRSLVRAEGDAFARFDLLLAEVAQSLDLADACLDRLAVLRGPVNVRLPKVVRAPEGAIYVRTENPLGIMGYYLVSRGERTPWRLHMRTASFNNVQALRAMLPGLSLPALPAVLASMFFVVGDIDK